MISRHWSGIAKRDRAAEYIKHLLTDTFPAISKINGFVSSRILQREVNEGVEFLIITEWESIDSIKEFAGEAYHIAVVPQVVKEIMVRYDIEVKHYTVI